MATGWKTNDLTGKILHALVSVIIPMQSEAVFVSSAKWARRSWTVETVSHR